MSTEFCNICSGEFLGGSLIDGKCALCKAAYPNANNLSDAIVTLGKKQEVLLTLTENRVKEIVNEILIAVGLPKCESCGNLFLPRSPSQKVCQKCRELEPKTDKVS